MIPLDELSNVQASNALKQRNSGRITAILSILLSTYTNGVRRFRNSFIPYLPTKLNLDGELFEGSLSYNSLYYDSMKTWRAQSPFWSSTLSFKPHPLLLPATRVWMRCLSTICNWRVRSPELPVGNITCLCTFGRLFRSISSCPKIMLPSGIWNRSASVTSYTDRSSDRRFLLAYVPNEAHAHHPQGTFACARWPHTHRA